jgi:rhodanese-related sulfurtransferase
MNSVFRQVLILLALAALPAAICAFVHPRRPVWDISAPSDGEVLPQTALAWKEKALWLDARSAADFNRDHVPGAMLLNEDDWDTLLPRVLDAWTKDRIIVVYCSNLGCEASKEVAARLRHDARLPRVYVLKGGWEAWLATKK